MPTQDSALLRQYQQLMESGGYIIFLTDCDGKFTHLSESVTALTGFTPADLAGQHFTVLADPDWRQRLEAFYSGQFQAGEGAATITYPLITRQGERRWAEQVMCLSAQDDEPCAFQGLLRDVTQRQQDEIRYRALYDQTNDAIFILDLNGAYLDVNRRAADMLGYSREELLSLNFSYTVMPDELHESAHVLEMLKRGETVTVYERTFRRKDGRPLQAEINVQLVRDSDGHPLHIQSVVRDISERKASEQALRATETRNRAMLQAIPDNVFVMSRDGVFVEFEWHGPELLPIPVDQIIGANIRDLDMGTGLADLALNAIQEAIATRQPQTFIYEPPPLDGHVVAYEERVVALNDHEAMFIVRDISSLRKAEQELAERVRQLTILSEVEEELADQLKVDYVLTMGLDAAVRLSAASSGYIALLGEKGVMKVEKVAGSHNAAIANENLRKGIGAVSRVIRQCRPEFIRDVRQDPDYIVNREATRAQITIPLISQERMIGVLNLESDKDDAFNDARFDFLKLMAGRVSVALDNARLYNQVANHLAQVQELYEKVSRLEQLKTDMIRIASHDLRNPLSTILGYTELIRWETQQLTEKNDIAGMLKNIEMASRRMQKLVADILSLERIEEMAQHNTIVAVDMGDLVTRVFEENKPQARLLARHLHLEIPEERLIVQADQVQLREAVTNLISNAIKYTREDGEIHVRLWREDQSAVMEVQDNGYGIREEQQARLFEPFYRARTSDTVAIEGTGLGLHLVKNIIERHGGTLRFKSVFGEGSTFGIVLPLSETGADQ